MRVDETATSAIRERHCPGCGGSSVSLVPGRGLPFNASTRSAVFRQNEYRILRCANCGLVYKDSILSEEQFSRYYSDFEYSTWEAINTYPTEIPILRFLETLPSQSKVLDFGCSTGRLLAQVPGDHRLYGFEINREAAGRAVQRGINIIDKWDELATHSKSLDALLMIDVFEHIEKPTSLLKALIKLIKPGGTLVIATGSADCWACRADLPNFWYFRNIQHVAMLTKQYCEYLSTNFGLRITKFHKCSHYRLGLIAKAAQYLRHLLFLNLQKKRPFAFFLLRCPLIPKRCRNWMIPPPFSASNDHVVVFFQKAEITPEWETTCYSSDLLGTSPNCEAQN